MKVGSLFSGIGGLELGLERAGMAVRWQVEWNDYCRKVLAQHWPTATRYSDITEVDWSTVEPVDIICGGFPCQPVSLAGKQLAQDDARWLWPYMAAAIRVLRPRYVVVENVPGLLVRGFGDVLGDLADLGFDAEWEVLPASAFGCFHERARVVLVAYPAALDGDTRGCLGPRREWSAPLAARRLSSVAAALRGRQPGARLEREPRLARLVHGVPNQTHRLEACGNAVVPAVAQWVGERIVEHAQTQAVAA